MGIGKNAPTRDNKTGGGTLGLTAHLPGQGVVGIAMRCIDLDDGVQNFAAKPRGRGRGHLLGIAKARRRGGDVEVFSDFWLWRAPRAPRTAASGDSRRRLHLASGALPLPPRRLGWIRRRRRRRRRFRIGHCGGSRRTTARGAAGLRLLRVEVLGCSGAMDQY